MKKNKMINEGGVNGLGESLINVKSQDFLELKELIKAKYKNQNDQEIINNGLLSVRFQMESYLTSNTEGEYIRSGEFIEKYLKVVNAKKKQLAEYIDYEYSNLISLIKGRRKINSDLAIKLGEIFRIDPVIWLHIESKNELIKEMSKRKKSNDKKLSLLEMLSL